MHRTEPPLAALCLALLAGFIDAIAFTSLGGFFVAFMSGNATRLGVAIGGGARGDALIAGALILSFASGVILASVVVRALAARLPVAAMALMTLLLTVAGALAEAGLITGAGLALAVAAGAGHLLLSRGTIGQGGEAGLTALLVRTAERLAGALMGDADRWGWLVPLMLGLTFVAGAALGLRMSLESGMRAVWAVAIIAAALTLGQAWLMRRRSGTRAES